MDLRYADAHYTTLLVHDNKQGYSALELYRSRKSEESSRVAWVVFWDACGEFFLETFNVDIPVPVADTLVAEAKATIKIR
jgi:hypothetical protein